MLFYPIFERKIVNFNEIVTKVGRGLPGLRAYLYSFPSSAGAVESYCSIGRFLGSELRKGYSTGYTNTLFRFGEKLFLWLVGVKQMPIGEIEVADLGRFLDFCCSPPPEWTCDVNERRRFVKNEKGDTVAFPEWRPFRQVESRCCPVQYRALAVKLWNYLDLSSNEITNEKVRFSISVSEKPAPSESDQEFDMDRLSTEILSYYVGKANRSVKYEPALLVFGTCMYLRMSLKELAAMIDDIEFGSLSMQDNRNWVLKIPGNPMPITSPPEYIELVRRFKSLINPAEANGEIISCAGLFRTSGARRPTLTTLRGWLLPPDDYGYAISPMLCISRLLKAEHDRKADRATYDLLRRKSPIYQHDTESLLSEISSGITPSPVYSIGANGSVEPIFNQWVNFPPPVDGGVIPMQIQLMADRFPRYEGVSVSEVIRRVRSYERFLLWVSYINGGEVTNLSAETMKEFFLFCIDPPADWASRFTHRRLVNGDGGATIVNPNWRPFRATLSSRGHRMEEARRTFKCCGQVFSDMNLNSAMWNNFWMKSFYAR